VGPRIDLDDVEKRKFLTPPGLELRSLSRYTDYSIPAEISLSRATYSKNREGRDRELLWPLGDNILLRRLGFKSERLHTSIYGG
jgi:hypothetical protein